MDKDRTYQIIDSINQLSEKAADILYEGLEDAQQAFFKIRPFLGTYCGETHTPNQILDRTTLNNCRQYVKSCQDGYYCAMEFLDIDIEPITEIAKALEEQGFKLEAGLVWEVVNTVCEVRQWANHQSEEEPELPYNNIARKHGSPAIAVLGEEEFLAMFDSSVKESKAKMLLNHIREVSSEKSVHTYYGALAQECTNWFKYQERDFSNLVRSFLSVAGLDPALASNVRKTKLGEKNVNRAKEKFGEISTSRARP